MARYLPILAKSQLKRNITNKYFTFMKPKKKCYVKVAVS